MNKILFKLFALGVIFGGAHQGRSQDLLPPCWRGTEGSTFQAWQFLTSDNPASPELATNSYGPASAAMNVGSFGDGYFASWPSSTNQGFWDLGQAGTISLVVPNRPTAPPASSKYIRVQVGQYIGGVYPNYAAVAISGATYLGGQRVLAEPVPPFGGIYVDQTLWRLEPNPSSESITITSASTGGLINGIVVDTICITNANTYVDDSYTGSDCDQKGWPDAVAPLDKPLNLLAFANFQTGVERAPAGGIVNVAPGTYAAVNVNKAVTVNLGAPTAQASMAGLMLGASATLAMDVNGTTPGSGHDQWIVSGDVTLGGAALGLTSGAPLALNDTIVLINNTGANPVSGTFAGLAEGATNLIAGQQFKITYTGGSGNDVVLTMVNHAPIPAAKIAETDENVAATMLTAKFLAGATDSDAGDVISYAGVLPASAHGGTVVSNASGATYTPPVDYSGPDEFYFLLSDGKAVSVGTVSVTVRPAGAGTLNMLPLIFNESDQPIVRFVGVLGHTYELQRSVDTATGPWTVIATYPIPTVGSAVVEHVDAEVLDPVPTSRFYRTRHVSGP